MSMPSIAAVRVAGPADVTAVGDVLGTAFADTPLGRRVSVDHNARKGLLRQIFTGLAGWAVEHGTVHLRDDGAGAAIWLPADGRSRPHTALTDNPTDSASHDTVDTMLPDIPGTGDAAGDTRALLNELAGMLHPTALAGEPTTLDTFLVGLGVDPDARREGVARQLLAAHHASLDPRHAPSLAVAIDLNGQLLYQAAGYRPHHVDQAGDLHLHWMVRRPP